MSVLIASHTQLNFTLVPVGGVCGDPVTHMTGRRDVSPYISVALLTSTPEDYT